MQQLQNIFPSIFQDLFIYLKETVTEEEMERNRACKQDRSSHSFTPQMAATDKAWAKQNQELKTPSWSPTWVAGTQVLRPFSPASQTH